MPLSTDLAGVFLAYCSFVFFPLSVSFFLSLFNFVVNLPIYFTVEQCRLSGIPPNTSPPSP